MVSVSAEDRLGRFEEKHPDFKKIVPEGAVVEKVDTGFRFTEGPVWNAKEDCLRFSDIPANIIYLWRSGKKSEVFRDPSGHSNGLTYDKQGRLIACEHGNRRVSRTERDGSITVLAERYEGKRLNSPNDVVVKSDGSLYFTDPPYGLKKQKEDKELDFQGVYRISPDGKTLTLLIDDFDRPNGLAFSPDEKTLYIADSSKRRHIRAFDVKEDGTLANGRLFANLHHDDPGVPDGMKVDVEGNVYSTGPGGVWVFNPKGELLGRIVTPEVPANCAWGDADWKSLYTTARTSVYRVKLSIQGIKVP
ncbi:MAG: SMP-30/gluconolactonase/LRE family protein [Planctomycetes bacterium]|nr:SMP-30/gluconolactonase/LRE family protein [Planctomycetota bacterium]